MDNVFADVYTLAHESGHSMHTWFSQESQRFQDYEYPIFLAEVASTFNEELLTHHLLGQTSDPKMRAYIINRQIEDLRGTLFRQTMFAEFERIIHGIEESGDALKAAGVDMATPAPIESTLRLFERRLDELESFLL